MRRPVSGPASARHTFSLWPLSFRGRLYLIPEYRTRRKHRDPWRHHDSTTPSLHRPVIRLRIGRCKCRSDPNVRLISIRRRLVSWLASARHLIERRNYLSDVGQLSGRCRPVIWPVSASYLAGVGQLSGRCRPVIWAVSARQLISVGRFWHWFSVTQKCLHTDTSSSVCVSTNLSDFEPTSMRLSSIPILCLYDIHPISRSSIKSLVGT